MGTLSHREARSRRSNRTCERAGSDESETINGIEVVTQVRGAPRPNAAERECAPRRDRRHTTNERQERMALGNVPDTEKQITSVVQAVDALKEVQIRGIQGRGYHVRVLTSTEREAALLRTNDRWVNLIFEGARKLLVSILGPITLIFQCLSFIRQAQ